MRNELKIGKESDYGEGTPVPATSDLGELRRKAAKCQACPLFRSALKRFGKAEQLSRLYWRTTGEKLQPGNRLIAELHCLQPESIVCLGASAVRSAFGKDLPILNS